jgi:glycosyltransferase involved in cell wall biosynthesis
MENKDKVLVGTKVKNGELWLPRFIQQVENLEGNISRIVILYGESTDKSYAYLKHWQETSKHKIEIYKEPYLPPEERAGHSLARVKQDMQRILAEGTEDYYFNVDSDLVVIPPDTITRLMSHNKDLIASMVWTEGRKHKTFFDIYIYRLTDCMFHPYNPPGLNQTDPFTVDSVSTCYLAKREVELAGVYSNPYPPIPFCATLRQKGFMVWVDPQSSVYHIDLERFGIAHNALNHPYSQVPFITDKGEKLAGQVIGAQRLQYAIDDYEHEYLTKNNTDAFAVKQFLDSRPLITAAIKVLNDGDFIEYCLGSIYDYVDRIDIVEGACRQAAHRANPQGESTDTTVEKIKAFPDPQHKIKLVRGAWSSKEEIQAKLLELCMGKWMLYIDADEVLSRKGAEAMRKFCLANQQGEAVYARPAKFLNFFHDFQHIAYSLIPTSPWYQYGLPHPFLIWRDIPGLNFYAFHTLPRNGLGYYVHWDRMLGGDPAYTDKQKVLDDVVVYHFGNAKKPSEMKAKLLFERIRDRNPTPVEADFWFTGVLPPEFMLEEYLEKLPAILDKHPWRHEQRIKISEVKPQYKFEVLPQ